MSVSSAALDLAHMSQLSPRNSFSGRTADNREKSSEWPQFNANPRVPDGIPSRTDRRTVTNPTLTLSSTLDELSNANKLGGTVSASATPHTAQHPQGMAHPVSAQTAGSRRGSPPVTLDSLSAATRSVPATPLGGINGAAAHLIKTPGTHTPDTQGFGSRINSQGPLQAHENAVNAGDLQASLSRLPSGQYENGSLTFNSIQSGHDESMQVIILPPIRLFILSNGLTCLSNSMANLFTISTMVLIMGRTILMVSNLMVVIRVLIVLVDPLRCIITMVLVMVLVLADVPMDLIAR